MEIIKFEEKYRDDMIFVVLSAKDALGRIPGLNEDLLDVRKNYIDRGDMFWLAIENGRVLGCVGYSSVDGTSEAVLHRLFVKPDRKREGIGTALLLTAEEYMRQKGKTAVRINLGRPREQWFESYAFYRKCGYSEYADAKMIKQL